MATPDAGQRKPFKCLRCSYSWFPRVASRPVKCPNCQARNWDEKKKPEKGGKT